MVVLAGKLILFTIAKYVDIYKAFLIAGMHKWPKGSNKFRSKKQNSRNQWNVEFW